MEEWDTVATLAVFAHVFFELESVGDGVLDIFTPTPPFTLFRLTGRN